MELSLDIDVLAFQGDGYMNSRASVCLVEVPIPVLTIIESAAGRRMKLNRDPRMATNMIDFITSILPIRNRDSSNHA